jgi:hypothetical protein
MDRVENQIAATDMGTEFTTAQREYLDTRMALAVLEQMYKDGEINEKTIQGIRKKAAKRLDVFRGKC